MYIITELFHSWPTNATLEISQSELSSVSANEGVNFKIRLNNNEDTSDLYENPVFEIRLPQAIKEARIKNIDLFYANNELEIAKVEKYVTYICNEILLAIKMNKRLPFAATLYWEKWDKGYYMITLICEI